jgi:predicted nucleic-acid-binding protein
VTNRIFLTALACLASGLAAAGNAVALDPSSSTAKPQAPATASASGQSPAKKEQAPPPATTYVQLRVPLSSEALASVPVAQVDDEIITGQEFSEALANAHSSHAGDAKAGKKDFTPILDRLIETRLFVLEARDIGLDEQPEYTRAVEKYKDALLRDHLKRKVTASAKPDPARVEKLYKDATREWKLRSLLFKQEEDARQVAEQLKTGKSFEDAAAKLVSDKKAQGGEEPKYFSVKNLLPQVVASLEKMKPGDVSQPIKMEHGYAVLKLIDVRNGQDAKARAEAEQSALSEKRLAALKQYYDALKKKAAQIDWKLLVSIDYESPKPGLAALAKDTRVLVRFKRGKPITVVDLTDALQNQFFHGIEGAIKERRVNSQKGSVLDVLVSNRIIPAEARRLGIADTAEYKKGVADYVNSLLFSMYLEKVIVPDIKVTDADLRKYYDGHKREFTYPALYKLESMAFTDVKKAQAAIDKLRSGTDFKWLRTNADGQVNAADQKLHFDGNTVTAGSLPKDLADALAGSKRGDYRLYASPQGEAYVLSVLDAIATAEQAYDEVRGSIQEKVAGERLSKAIKEHADKLRKAHEVQVFITRIGD